jgi:hypothetical protein
MNSHIKHIRIKTIFESPKEKDKTVKLLIAGRIGFSNAIIVKRE